MTKKLIVACVSLVAFAALAIPSLASAATLTENGTAVPAGATTGALIQATNTETIVLHSSIGDVLCSSSKLTGRVLVNSGGTVKGTITVAEYTGTGTESRCTSTIFGNPQFKVTVENLPYCLESESGKDAFTVKGGNCTTEGNLKFTLSSSLGNCTYEKTTPATTPLTGTFVTNTTPAVLKFEKQTFTRTAGTLCAASAELQGAYKLETDASPATELTIS